jgi:hypothetical protein
VPAIAISVCFSALLFVEALGHFAHLDRARLHRQLSIADDVSHAIQQIENRLKSLMLFRRRHTEDGLGTATLK